jgi:hypothetical protein
MPNYNKFLRKYIPKILTRKDRAKQYRMLTASKNAYKKHRYLTRKKVDSYLHRPSKHLYRLRQMYGVENALPTRKLARASGCSQKAMKQIIRKGEGAYYSSGSRPNQTARSWGVARLASALTGGKAGKIDYHILRSGCDPKKPALKLIHEHYPMNNHEMNR